MNFQRVVVRYPAGRGRGRVMASLISKYSCSSTPNNVRGGITRQLGLLFTPCTQNAYSTSRSLHVNDNRNFDPQRRWMTSKPDSESIEVLYEGPMSRMITTLKVFSLSSAVLSTVGLPALMLSRGVDMYTGIHVMMVATTMAGSIGSTLGLQYIFAPYVYKLERIPIPQCQNDEEGDTDKANPNEEVAAAAPTLKSNFLLKATTRSIFAMKVEHVFDPETDVTGVPAGTIRPFCSFFAKGLPLYIHEQMIQDPLLSQNLFTNKATPIQKHKNPDPDDEFL